MMPLDPVNVVFSFELTGMGWAECTLDIGTGPVTAMASYLSDALGDLSRAILTLLQGASSARTFFEEEPGEYRWLLERIGPDVRIQLLWFDDLNEAPDSEGEVLVDGRCSLYEFATAVALELRRLYRRYGEQGYLEEWAAHPFPTSEMRQIEEAISPSPKGPSTL